VSEQVIIVRTS